MNGQLRASDADRDHAAEQLRAHYVAGRLTRDELGDRLGAALSAVTLDTLRQTLSDLPEPHRQGPAQTARPITAALRSKYPALPRRGKYPALPRRGLRWRATAILTGAGAVAGLLAGIPFATVTATGPMIAAIAGVNFGINGPGPTGKGSREARLLAQYDAGLTGQGSRYYADLASVARSHQFLAALARTTPGISEPELRQAISAKVIFPDDGASYDIVVIRAQAHTAPEARALAKAAAASYNNFLRQNLRQKVAGGVLPAEFGTAVPYFYRNGADPYPVLAPHGPVSAHAGETSNAGETSALGALIGALLGSLTTIALGRRRRRSDDVWGGAAVPASSRRAPVSSV